jgi:hypothetical protein
VHVDSYSFGRITIDGVEYTKDVLMVNGEVRSPWLRSAGGHLFALVDLAEVLGARPEVVVLGTGYFGLVRVAEETRSAVAAAGTRVVCERTGRAVQELNRLAASGCDVAAAFHLTC